MRMGITTLTEIITYRFTRLPFGLTFSPFLLSAAIRELADIYKAKFPTAAALADNTTFMDDFATGTENDDGVTNLNYELIYLMNQIRPPMAKWATNSKHLKEVRRTEGVDLKVTQTLGIDWDTESETFTVMSPAKTLKVLPLRGTSCKLRPDFMTPWAYYPPYPS